MFKQPLPTTATTEEGLESATPEEREPTLLEKLTRQEPDSSGGGKEKEGEKGKLDSQLTEEGVAETTIEEPSGGVVTGVVGYESPEETTKEVPSGGAVRSVVGYESPGEGDSNSDEEDTNETNKPPSELRKSDDEQAQNDKDLAFENTEDRIPLEERQIFDRKSILDESRVGRKPERKSVAEDEEEEDEDLSRYELFEEDDEEEEEADKEEHKTGRKDDTDEEGEDVEDIDKQLERELEQKKVRTQLSWNITNKKSSRWYVRQVSYQLMWRAGDIPLYW